ncbi:hypothetical protein [Bradyrhizobium sp. 2TAF24]|uniref:hypothetical protein n=1 Tax=Bradyrhizobium sp. 2TAF24 TaxID=3233011 RepID=UPI0025957C48|nr:hypothetical protein [uncultured Sphingomonas sp.]
MRRRWLAVLTLVAILGGPGAAGADDDTRSPEDIARDVARARNHEMSIPDLFHQFPQLAPPAPKPLYLYYRQRRTCRVVQATYDYEAWVQDDKGNRVPAHIELYFWRPLGPVGGAEHTCDNTTWCPFTDRQAYGTISIPGLSPGGGACTKSVFHACARVNDTSWCTADNVLE